MVPKQKKLKIAYIFDKSRERFPYFFYPCTAPGKRWFSVIQPTSFLFWDLWNISNIEFYWGWSHIKNDAQRGAAIECLGAQHEQMQVRTPTARWSTMALRDLETSLVQLSFLLLLWRHKWYNCSHMPLLTKSSIPSDTSVIANRNSFYSLNWSGCSASQHLWTASSLILKLR